MSYLYVFLLGGLGALCRVLVVSALPARPFPAGTLAVNVLGCLLIGALSAWFAGRTGPGGADPELRWLLAAGFLGGFTTFSAFGIETWELLREGAVGTALTYAAASVLAGVGGAALGTIAARGAA